VLQKVELPMSLVKWVSTAISLPVPALIVISITVSPCVSRAQVQGASAQQPAQTSSATTQQAKEVKHVLRVGARIQSANGSVNNVLVTMPVPVDWPEQHVSMFEENLPDEVSSSSYRETDTVRQLLAKIPQIPPSKQIEFEILFEVTVKEVLYPDRTDHLQIPEKPPLDVRQWLSPGDSIESRTPHIRKQAESLADSIEQPWEKVRAIYNWVTTSIEVDKSIKETGAKDAIKNLKGSPEDRSYAFIALCRSIKIPARMVWADNGEYAEFYLQDDAGEGRWYPAVVEGKTEFGKMSDPRVILQKGDNIKVADKNQKQLFVTENIIGSGQLKSVLWIRDVLPARDSQ
jgi:Transglutaminase-like superfamily